MQVTDSNGYIFGPNGLQVNGPDGKPKVISGGGGSGSIPHGTASGTDTYTVSIAGATSYADGDTYLVRFTNGNTTGATLNVNGLGAIPLYRNNDGQVIGGDIQSGAEMLCIYNSTLNIFQVIGSSPNTLLAYVTNAESITITKGQPVYAFGGQGDRLKVKLAYNTSDATSAQTVGLVLSASIGANQKGFIILNGQLDGLSILHTSTWADGDPVYLGATAGSITKTKPKAPNHLVYLGFVTTANNGSAGRMYVRVQNGYEMDELHDVQITSVANNDLIQYDSATSLWKNRSLSSAGIQPTLVNTTNIKSINGNSLLGSGDLTISTSTSWGSITGTLSSQSDLNTALSAKQDTLVSGTSIKTINSSSILGSGNINMPQILYTNHTILSLTGNTTEYLKASVPIPTTIGNSMLRITFIAQCLVLGTAGNPRTRIRIGTVASPSNAQLTASSTIAQNAVGSASTVSIFRNMTVTGGASGSILGASFAGNILSDQNMAITYNTQNVNWTTQQYLYFTVQNAATNATTQIGSITVELL